MDGGCAVSHIATHRQGFAAGYTAVTRAADAVNFTGIGFGVLRLAAGETWRGCIERETAWLLMSGAARVKAGDLEAALARTSLFDESASCLHAATGTLVELHASVATELTVYDCLNMRGFAPRIFRPADVPNEPRGKGQVRDRSLRYVRTIFDAGNSPPEAQLVLGEVVTFPGGWSSYPPHKHDVHAPPGEVPAAPPSAAGDLPLPLHRTAGLRPRRTPRSGRKGARVRHGVHPRRARSRPVCRARLRHVLLVGHSSPAWRALHGAQLHAGACLDDVQGRAVLVARRGRS